MNGDQPLIGFDARMWSHPGIGRYVRELLGAIFRSPNTYRWKIIANRQNKSGSFLGDSQSQVVAHRSGIYGFGEQWEIPRLAKGTDVFHSPHFNIPIGHRGRLVVTVHDLTYLRRPDSVGSVLGRAYVDHLFKQIAKKAMAVLAVSEYTRNDLLNYLPSLSPERVLVTHEAASSVFRPIADKELLAGARQKYGLFEPFCLFVGTLKPHKNVLGLLEAMTDLREAGKTRHELVVIGSEDPKRPDIMNKLRGAGPWVRHFRGLTDEEIALFYNLADLFVLPSFYEGFGLPALEAMACGKPVILSKASSLPEIGGEAALYFEPGRIDALSDLIYNVSRDDMLKAGLSQRSLEQAARFSWEKTARQTLGAYDKVLKAALSRV